MIKLNVVNNSDQHFLISSNEPVRVEVSVIDGHIIAEVYEGLCVDSQQEPIGGYYGGDRNTNWSKGVENGDGPAGQ